MEVEDVIVADKVPGLGGHLELFVVPVDDAHPVRLAVRQVSRKITPDPRPKQRRNPSCRRKMVLINVIQHLVIKRDEVLDLRLRDPVLGGGDVGEGVGDQHPAVLVLHSLEELEHGVHHVVHQYSPLGLEVAFPSKNKSSKSKFSGCLKKTKSLLN